MDGRDVRDGMDGGKMSGWNGWMDEWVKEGGREEGSMNANYL